MNNPKTNQNQAKVIIHSGSSQEWIDSANIQSVGEQLEDILQKLPSSDGDVVLLFSLTKERLDGLEEDDPELYDALKSQHSEFVDWTLFDYLGIGGGEGGRYHCDAWMSDGRQFILTNPQGSTTTFVSLCVGQPASYPLSHVVSFNMAKQAALYFVDHNALDPSLAWEVC
jgi:hypothetical protein